MNPETNWTPGPWVVQRSEAAGCLLIKPVPGQIVAACDETPEMAANASLMAAAPDEDAALLKAERFISAFEDDELQEGVPQLLAEIRAALAKARGAA